MRLARLDLTRYGRFTDEILDFGLRQTERPDFHVIYGPNEAGKSTAFSAFLDLLFGIESQSRFDFLHPYKTMRVGAALERPDGSTADFIRIKRPQSSLLDGAERPVGEGALLGGLDRESYRAMFSLDDKSLERGGESILASKGHLGELLFAASAGLAGLGQSLDAIRQETEGFHRVKSRSDALYEIKRELDRLKAERDQLDTLQPAYKALMEARVSADSRYRAALAERDAARTRLGEVVRLIEALPKLARLHQLRAQAAPLAELPEPPLGWAEELPILERSAIELAAQRDACVAEIARLTALRDALVVDERALNAADAIGRLDDSKYKTADDNLPRRRTTLAEQNGLVAGLLRQLDRPGEPDPDRLVLGASAVGRLRELIESRSGITAAVDEAARQLADDEQALSEGEDALARAGGGAGPVTGLERLKAILSSLRATDQSARRRLAERAKAVQMQAWQDALPSLLPWSGDPEALVSLRTPTDAALTQWQTRDAEIRKALDLAEQDMARLRQAVARLRAEQHAAEEQGGVISDSAAVLLRAERERAWAEHRRDLAPASADAFERALRQDDRAVASRMGRDAELARLRQVGQALAAAESDLRHAEAEHAKAAAQRELMRADLAQAASPMGWTASVPSASEVQAWLDRRKTALAIRAAWRDAETELAEIDQVEREARAGLVAALMAAGRPLSADGTLAEAVAEGEAIIDRETALAGLRSRVESLRSAVAKRRRHQSIATEADRAWADAWRAACGACWLGEKGDTPSLAAVRETLDRVNELGVLLRERAALSVRIAQMEADQTAFARAVDEIANSVPLPAGGTPLERADLLRRAAEVARIAHDRRTDLVLRLNEVEAQRRSIERAYAVHDQRVATMQAFFAVPTLAALGDRLRQASERRSLRQQIDVLERGLVEGFGTPTLAQAEAALAGADHMALVAERDVLAPRLEELDQVLRELFAAARKAGEAVEAVASDAAAARLVETRRTLLLETEDKALRYLRLKIGIAAAEQALRLYRETHRSSMMAHASEAFRTISRGVYSGLAAQPGEKGDILVAVGQGGSKEAAQLSKGTRFQLYLSLRVAGYHEYCRTHEPVPFVADDIMETFDDFRAEEAFRLFTGMAEVGQVIYLTHHRHLCDIARAACPTVNIIELPGALQAAAA